MPILIEQRLATRQQIQRRVAIAVENQTTIRSSWIVAVEQAVSIPVTAFLLAFFGLKRATHEPSSEGA